MWRRGAPPYPRSCVCVCPTPPRKHELGACGTSRSLLGVGGTPWWGGGQGGPLCPSPSCLALGFWNLHPTNLALSPSTSLILGGTRAQWGDVGVIQGSADMGGGVGEGGGTCGIHRDKDTPGRDMAMGLGTPPPSSLRGMWGHGGSRDPWGYVGTRGDAHRFGDKGGDTQMWRPLTSSAGCTWLSARSNREPPSGSGGMGDNGGCHGGTGRVTGDAGTHLASAAPHDEVGDEGVLSLARAVTHRDPPAVARGQLAPVGVHRRGHGR